LNSEVLESFFHCCAVDGRAAFYTTAAKKIARNNKQLAAEESMISATVCLVHAAGMRYIIQLSAPNNMVQVDNWCQ